MTLRVFSFGGGVQSMAALVLAVLGKINFQTFLFCNVGEDSEHPATLKYLREIAMPYAQKHAIQLLELDRVRMDGTHETLLQVLTRPGSRSIPIPVRMSNGAPGRRACTADFKIKVVDRWLREHGAKEQGAIVGLGISWDEIHRMKPNMDEDTLDWKENVHPLIDLSLTRFDCIDIIKSAGLPVPPKSSCWFCPFHKPAVWQEMRLNEPLLFWKAVALERLLNERREALGRDPVYFTRFNRPLDQVTTDLVQGQLFEFEDEMCESGYCMV